MPQLTAGAPNVVCVCVWNGIKMASHTAGVDPLRNPRSAVHCPSQGLCRNDCCACCNIARWLRRGTVDATMSCAFEKFRHNYANMVSAFFLVEIHRHYY